MPVKALHHLDLAVADVERSLQFYLTLLGPLGAKELYRFPTYRGTEEVVYLGIGPGKQAVGFRRADAGEHRYYGVGVEHFAISVDRREEVEAVYDRAVEIGARIHFPVEERTATSPDIGLSSSSIPTAFVVRCSVGLARMRGRSGRPGVAKLGRVPRSVGVSR